MRPRRDLIVLTILCSLIAAVSSFRYRSSLGAVSELRIVSAKGARATSLEVTQAFFGGHSGVVSFSMEGCGNAWSRTRTLSPEILREFLRSADFKHFQADESATRICFRNRDYIEVTLVDGSGTHHYAGFSGKNPASVQAAQALIWYVAYGLTR